MKRKQPALSQPKEKRGHNVKSRCVDSSARRKKQEELDLARATAKEKQEMLREAKKKEIQKKASLAVKKHRTEDDVLAECRTKRGEDLSIYQSDEEEEDDEHNEEEDDNSEQDERGEEEDDVDEEEGSDSHTPSPARVGSKTSSSKSGSEWLVKEPVPNGPIDGTIIPSFCGHVAYQVWTTGERKTLKMHTRALTLNWLAEWMKDNDDLRNEVVGTGLSHLPACMHDTIDVSLINAFIERWQPDTNTFHLPFGEMTIMLHDVERILRIPIDGEPVNKDLTSTEVQELVKILCKVDTIDMHSFYQSGGVTNVSVVNTLMRNPGVDIQRQVEGWLWLALGSTLFVDKSGNRIRPGPLHEIQKGIDTLSSYSWGSAVLAHMYRQMGMASRIDAGGIAGCLTLLQTWIYEYFRPFDPICNIPTFYQ